MKKDELKQLINQVKKYNLGKAFDTPKEFDKWLNKLNTKQIQNINSLNIEPSKIHFPKELLINENLLNCDDYSNRIDAMLKLKNADGWYHLFDRLCSLNFLNSKNYYEDMEIMSKAISIQHPLWIISKDSFINSPYHKEDLKLIVEARDTKKEDGKELDWLVEEALTTVAGDSNSINSHYHREDMKLIATSGSECLQMSNSYPEHSLNNLAINNVSLKDKYHLENMKILAKNYSKSKYLYKLMTNPEIIKSKYYRNEIDAIINSKSLITAIAIYYYVLNPNDSLTSRDYNNLFYDLNLDCSDISLITRENTVRNNNNSNYLKHLQLLNKIEDKYVLYIESLLSNKFFIDSKNFEYDLNTLLTIKDKDTFMDLYKLMFDEQFLESTHHIRDLDLISKTENRDLRSLLISKAIDEDSIISSNHDYDMKYISKLDLNGIDDDFFQKMKYYLFTKSGINHLEHVERLEKLLKGENIQTGDAILNHLDYLENNLDKVVSSNRESKVLSKIRKVFKK